MTTSAVIVIPLNPTVTGASPSVPNTAQRDIATLTEGMAAGDEEAFRQFHTDYFDRLLRYIVVVARGDEEAARDALQETFTRVVRHARRFDSEEVFWCWLTVLARSATVDGGRKRRRYWQTLSNYARSFFGVGSAPDSTEDVEAHLLELVLRGVSGLSSEDRDLVEGKYLRGASVRELAAEYGLSEKAVESRLGRARRSLREQVLRGLKDEEAQRPR